MTHLLISIDEMRALTEKLLKTTSEDDGEAQFIAGKLSLLATLSQGKQISLDDKDVEDKSEKISLDRYSEQNNPDMEYRARATQRLGFYMGYNQALKDLL